MWGGGGGGGNQPEFSVNGIFSPRDCRKQSANLILCSKPILSITPLSNLASNPVFGWGVGAKFIPLFSSVCMYVGMYECMHVCMRMY